jgi:hypothetical protein
MTHHIGDEQRKVSVLGCSDIFECQAAWVKAVDAFVLQYGMPGWIKTDLPRTDPDSQFCAD